MKHEEFLFHYKARYFKSGEITYATKQIVFVFHGYGQLAKYFLKKFDNVADEETVVIAPEGLHHFYLEGVNKRSKTKNNRVGATWMTRENRVMDIENYLTYLNAILAKEINGRTIPLTVLGFSQGAATATRWVLQGTIHFEKLILWAGIFPPDMDFDKGQQILKGKSIYHVIGEDDPFVNGEKIEEMRLFSKQLDISPVQISFKGGHELDSATLLKVLKKK